MHSTNAGALVRIGAPVVPVGVDAFGQSGTIADLYRAFDLTAGQIVNAALIATADR